MKISNGILLSLGWSQELEFTNDFVIETEAHYNRVHEIALDHGFDVKGEIFPNHWHFRSQKVNKRSAGDEAFHSKLWESPEIKWFQQQKIKKRTKRDYQATDIDFTDPLYKDMWYVNPNYVDPATASKRNESDDIRHMNITGAWLQGMTGKGVVVTILDDGIERTHPDLFENYDPQASYDINDEDMDPTPRYNPLNKDFVYNYSILKDSTKYSQRLTENVDGIRPEENMHGTRCAGQIAATANNGRCVPGIAFNANIGGIRMLDGDVTDLVEAKSIGFNPQHVDIYSASWGPDDDGRTVDGPAELAVKAFKYGAEKGRNGKGSIFVWASGNGGKYADNCNCDGYTTSIYTISVSSTTVHEDIPWYSEACASTLTTTYSSGSWDEAKILTTDLRGMCTARHTGTSASAPIAAAIVALTLEANPQLTWRDMQHIIVHASKRRMLKAADWKINGVGRQYSHRYGYGLMDAGAMVSLAKNWKLVSQQKKCEKQIISRMDKYSYKSIQPRHIPQAPLIIHFQLNKKDCAGGDFITKMEHVIAQLNIQFTHRGDLKMVLVSPSGTESVLMDKRPFDSSSRGYGNHEFLTVHMWDENPYGNWKLVIINFGVEENRHSMGVVRDFKMVIRGTNEADVVMPFAGIILTKDEKKNGLWPAVHPAYKLPRPRYTYRDINGKAYHRKPNKHYRPTSRPPSTFGSNVYKYLNQITEKFQFHPKFQNKQ